MLNQYYRLICICVVLLVIMVFGWVSWFKPVKIIRPYHKPVIINYKFLTPEETYRKLKKTHSMFIKFTPNQIHCFWQIKFSPSVYKLKAGNMLLLEYNCSTGVVDFSREHGSLMLMEKSDEIGSRLEKYKKIDLTKKRNKLAEVKTTDIIVFHKSRKGIGHIGIIERIDRRKQIVYMDINNKFKGIGFRYIQFGSSNIRGIYEFSFPIWAGKFYKEIKNLNL